MRTMHQLQVFSDNAITTACAAVYGDDEDHWTEVQYSYTRRALAELQKTVNDIRVQIMCDTVRGRVFKAVISKHGLLEACCMVHSCREELRQAADVISNCGSGLNGRRTVYNAAMTMLGLTRPEGVTLH